MCGYRKDYDAQYGLLKLVEKWKTTLNKNGYAGVVTLDLSKAFDTINHELLLAKLDAYGFDKSSLKLIKRFRTDRWHRTRINSSLAR